MIRQSETPAVVLDNITKIFGRFAALREVSAKFAAGRLYGIFGENGAGKSTLLRIVAGLLRPTRGSVTLLGASDLRGIRGQLGYMAHASLLYDEMNAAENLAYFAALYGIQERSPCEEAIAAVGLDPALKLPVGAYSQGMRQRLSLARAVVHKPRLLLLDEPFSNVDAASVQHMTRYLAKMRDAGATVLVATHQASHLEGMADESVWIDSGRITAQRAGIIAATERGREAVSV